MNALLVSLIVLAEIAVVFGAGLFFARRKERRPVKPFDPVAYAAEQRELAAQWDARCRRLAAPPSAIGRAAAGWFGLMLFLLAGAGMLCVIFGLLQLAYSLGGVLGVLFLLAMFGS
jgi:hypothetical protein